MEIYPRHNSLLIEIFKELGDEFYGKHSHICIIKINKKYTNYYEIHEYDGCESLKIKYDSYKLNKTTQILQQIMTIINTELSNTDKIHDIINIPGMANVINGTEDL